MRQWVQRIWQEYTRLGRFSHQDDAALRRTLGCDLLHETADLACSLADGRWDGQIIQRLFVTLALWAKLAGKDLEAEFEHAVMDLELQARQAAVIDQRAPMPGEFDKPYLVK